MKRRGQQPNLALTPPMVLKLGRLIFNGFVDEELSLLTNLPLNQIKLLRQGIGDIRVKRTALDLKDRAIERIKRGRGKLGGLIWFMSRRYPNQFADPATVLTLSSGNTTHNTLIVSAEVADKIINRSKQALTEIDKLIADKQPAEAPDSE